MLHGEGGVFCAGADLKAVGRPEGNRVDRRRRRADGADPDAPVQAGDRRDRRVTPSPADWSWRCGVTCGSPSADAVLGVFCRRWGVPLIDGGTVRLPAPDRRQPRHGPDPHRPAGAGRGGARDRPGQPLGGRRAEPGRRAGAGRVIGPLSADLPARGPPLDAGVRGARRIRRPGRGVRPWAALAGRRPGRVSTGSEPGPVATARSSRAPTGSARGPRRQGRAACVAVRPTAGSVAISSVGAARSAAQPRQLSSWASSIQASGRSGPAKALDRVELPVATGPVWAARQSSGGAVRREPQSASGRYSSAFSSQPLHQTSSKFLEPGQELRGCSVGQDSAGSRQRRRTAPAAGGGGRSRTAR